MFKFKHEYFKSFCIQFSLIQIRLNLAHIKTVKNTIIVLIFLKFCQTILIILLQSSSNMFKNYGDHSSAIWWIFKKVVTSYEANIRIRKICGLSTGDQVTNKHIIEFIWHISKQFETTNVIHWMIALLNYSKELEAHKLFENSIEWKDMQNLYRICIDDEIESDLWW